jgi:hypothetical protein
MARGYEDEPYDDMEPDQYRAARWPHSGIGIASFITGIMALLMVFGAFALVIVVVAGARRAANPPQEVVAFTGLLVLGAGLIALIGAGLGIGGCCQARRKKVFAIIGLIINALLLLAILAIFAVGVANRSPLRQANITRGATASHAPL